MELSRGEIWRSAVIQHDRTNIYLVQNDRTITYVPAAGTPPVLIPYDTFKGRNVDKASLQEVIKLRCDGYISLVQLTEVVKFVHETR